MFSPRKGRASVCPPVVLTMNPDLADTLAGYPAPRLMPIQRSQIRMVRPLKNFYNINIDLDEMHENLTIMTQGHALNRESPKHESSRPLVTYTEQGFGLLKESVDYTSPLWTGSHQKTEG